MRRPGSLDTLLRQPHQEPRRRDEWLRDRQVRCHWRLHKHRRTGRRISCRQFCSSGTCTQSTLRFDRSHGGIPRQSSIGTSGLVGQLLDALPHVAGPTVEVSASPITGCRLETAAHFLVVVVGYIPFGQPGLALTVLQMAVRGEKRRGEKSSPGRG